ncbi:PAS domain S-box protein [Stenotrophomonas sp. HITSZ_GD]|uniref:PAS domain S-box protein n=1 Tax=Stenotrophomonas sp. HITSZ_GD TaxID=3037248 RepID=UPI00240E3962|nr:PAS domain S-box protein [Stenotrophomonas sp. HITSZ_GD]MDG2524292.1 PAS domain S-box protein [Stenotrophomonas sp. HITSZ_GD]
MENKAPVAPTGFAPGAAPPSWAQSSVLAAAWGEPAQWEPSLRSALSLCLNCPSPALLLWGPSLNCIYNEPGAMLLGALHPAAFGRPLAELETPLQAELVAAVGAAEPALVAGMRVAPTADATGSWSCSPLYDTAGVAGVLCVRERPARTPHLVAAFEESPAFLAVLRGPDYVIESANQRMKQLLGERQIIDRPLRAALPEVVEQGVLTLLDQVRLSGQPFLGQAVRLVLERPFEAVPYESVLDFVYQPMRDEAGAVDAILVHGIDVTRQRRAEERNRFLLGLEDALMVLSEPQQILDTSVRLLCQHLQAHRAGYGQIDMERGTMRVLSDHVEGLPSLRGEFALSNVAEGFLDALLENRPWVVHDTQCSDAPPYLSEGYRNHGIRATLAVPLHKNGQLVAAMGVHQSTPRHWSEHEVELVRRVVARCWESMQRGRVQRQLAANEARLRRLADALPQIIFIADTQGVARFFNSRWHEYTGCDPNADAREAWDTAHTDAGLRRAAHAWDQALADGDGFEIECELRRYDGQYRWHLARALPVREDDGRINQWIGTYTDIHDRRSIEDRLTESEARFRKLCETVPAMIWMSDAQGNCVYWNPRWTQFTGQPPEEAIPRGWWEVVHPDDLARVRHGFLQALDERRAFSAEYRVRRRDGEYRWCMDTATAHFGVDGSFLGHIGSLMDISERKRIEDATASERSILGLITTGAPLAIVLDSIALSVEARGERSLRCSILLANADQTLLRCAAAPSLPLEYAVRFDGLAIAPEGTPCGRSAYSAHQVICEDIAADPSWGEHRTHALAMGIAACYVTPILGSNGVVLGTLAMYFRTPYQPTLHEQAMARSASHLAGIVIERNRIDAQLKASLQAEKDARNDAETASRIKDDFLATLSHELRTPLNAILGWSRLMQTESFAPENIGKGLVIIERSARSQAQIIDDLLDMSAILSGKVRLQPEHFDIGGLARSTIDLMRPTASAKQVELRVRGLEEGATPFFGDAGRLQQVLVNLLGNAIKFTPSGGRVELEMAAAPDHLRLSVHDSGVGIAPDFLPHVFDRFRQADASTTRRVGGLGLGLSISRQLIDLHGGWLGATSAGHGQGATFTLVLPYQHGVSVPRAHGPDSGKVGPLPQAMAGRLGKLHLLLVDDDDDSRDAAEHFLRHAGAQVTAAGSADAAEQLMRQHSFDALISDIAMPGRDGYELIQAVRGGGQVRQPQIPAIALTAYVREEDRERAMMAGFDGHMGKPLDPLGLVELIEALAARPGHAAPGRAVATQAAGD